MPRGRITRLFPERGYGFISTGEKDYYFREDAVQGAAFEELAIGGEVLFEAAEDRRDEGPRAESVRLARDEAFGGAGSG